MLTFKCLNDKAPLYLQNLVTLKKTNPTYELRPEHQLCRLEVPHTKYRKSESAFMHAAPDVWNKLPLPIHSIKNADIFKKQPKTHYFRQAYAYWLYWFYFQLFWYIASLLGCMLPFVHC